MDREALIRRLMATFLAEYEDHVGALDRDLLALEKGDETARTELLGRLFRTVHSLKGAARSVSVVPVEGCCHRLEAVLGAARDGLVPLGPVQLQLLLEASDALRDALARLRRGEDPDGGGLPGIRQRLDAAGGATLSPRAGPPTPAPPPPTPAAPATPPNPPAGPVAGPPSEPALPASQPSGRVRIDAAKLDDLLARSGELLVARRRARARSGEAESLSEELARAWPEWRHVEKPLRKLLSEQEGLLPRRSAAALERVAETLRRVQGSAEALARGMAADLHALDQVASPLEEGVREARMLPFRDACEGLERLVRDLARTGGKEVELAVHGGDVEIDRSVLEGIRSPLAHLVRNALDHGIEPPEERAAAGKPTQGRVTIEAARRHGGIEVVVSDDGRGVDLRRVREQAARRKLPVPDDDRELLRMVFLPGFSTARMITEVSGRGVGLDVVRHGVEALHGSVEIDSQAGRGARFLLALPATVSTLRAVLLQCAGQVFALPSANVRRLVRAGAADLGSVEGREVLLGPGAPVPVVPLAPVLGLAAGPVPNRGGKAVLAVVAAGGQERALAVDELLSEQDLIVKDLGPRLRGVPLVSGATILPSGSVALVLSPADVVHAASTHAPGAAVAASLAEAAPARRRRLLVVEDSVTTRTLERSILEAAGYEVFVAADGVEGWRVLQDTSPDLVVTDVEMPRLDGFGLTETIRASRRFHDLPVVLVTALASERDQARGLAVGADAYLVKSAFDQRNLLETISQLL